MNAIWLSAAAALLLGACVPALALASKGPVAQRLVGLQLTGSLTVLVLIALALGLRRPDYLVVPLVLALLSFAGTLVFTRLFGCLLLPVTLMIGIDVVVHGHLTPGGGFQGGVVLATGLHLLHLAGDYRALRRVRPVVWYELGEAAGMGAVIVLSVAGLISGAGFLADFLPAGRSGQLVVVHRYRNTTGASRRE